MIKRVLLSWSSGKDSAWALHVLRQTADVEVVALLTTINAEFDRVAMHAVRSELLRRQAEAAGLPLLTVPLPWPCSNAEYETRMTTALLEAITSFSITHVAFGDLFLQDIRAYREAQLAEMPIEPLFPLWDMPTPQLAREMIAGGLEAVLTCADPRVMPAEFAGAHYDREFLDALPPDIDPCGENGEFHTFAIAGPMFNHPIAVEAGDVVTRDGFVFADLLPR